MTKIHRMYPITPALTPEEWANDLLMGDDDFNEIPNHARHGVAAMALCRQPFGFTREDLWVLESAIAAEQAAESQFGSLESATASHDQVRALQDLMARIAALLPPGNVAP